MSSDYGDEDDFMNGLLADMDESLLRTPAKPPRSSSAPQKQQKPIARPNFSSQGSKDNSKNAVSRSSVSLTTKPILKPTVVFTPAKPGAGESYSTRIPDQHRGLADDIEGSFTPPPEEVCTFIYLLHLFLTRSQSNYPNELPLRLPHHPMLHLLTRPRRLLAA
jgi:hypothetical protein